MDTTLNKTSPSKLRWEHPNKLRYYQIYLSKDLLNDWIVTKSWGSLSSTRGAVTHTACASFDDAKKLIENLSRLRKKRGYILQNHIQ